MLFFRNNHVGPHTPKHANNNATRVQLMSSLPGFAHCTDKTCACNVIVICSLVCHVLIARTQLNCRMSRGAASAVDVEGTADQNMPMVPRWTNPRWITSAKSAFFPLVPSSWDTPTSCSGECPICSDGEFLAKLETLPHLEWVLNWNRVWTLP